MKLVEKKKADRLVFLTTAASLADRNPPVWYRWNGKTPDIGLDCSGLVTWCLKEAGGPDLRYEMNAAALWKHLRPVEEPKPGDLAFYGRAERVSHVMIFYGDGRVLGAAGGDSSTTSEAAARARNARVRFRRSVGYRPDFLGYRSLSEHMEE